MTNGSVQTVSTIGAISGRYDENRILRRHFLQHANCSGTMKPVICLDSHLRVASIFGSVCAMSKTAKHSALPFGSSLQSVQVSLSKSLATVPSG